jgi:hypothetical protein
VLTVVYDVSPRCVQIELALRWAGQGAKISDMANSLPRSIERRWIVLSVDGRYATLGRETDPCGDEIEAAEAALRAQGTAGWLAVMEGNPHVGRLPRLMQVRSLGTPEGDFASSADACVRGIIAQRRR